MAIDTSQVSSGDTERGALPSTMAAWVIRPEREGEPVDAFQLEEIEVPEPGAFEVIVRVMAAGVNYNNVWAALGEPVSVFGYGDHPQYGHHIGGSDASGIVWKVGEGVTRWKPGDEVVIHCNQASYEDPEVHGLDPTGRRVGRAGEGPLQGVPAVPEGRARGSRRPARHRVRARRPGDVPDIGARREAVRQGGDLCRHHRLQPRFRRALSVDAPE